MSKPVIECAGTVEAGHWGGEDDVVAGAQAVLDVAARYIRTHENQPFPADPVEISLLFTDDGPMAEINGQWRGKGKPTNVLSFPAFPIVPGDTPGPVLGDIVLARATIEREAADLGKPVDHHISHLLVHGFLHLFGYDHIDAEDAREMETLETRILAELGLSDPYGGTDPL
ncbi:MAG: rRNA maturation RNase YbeY [Rhizobiales bacterium]|nr:rRNA maturation RNase YbeY [Hyphomicrobiales bacterium]MBA67817.1 rRNA maturation RNase YbeY [Hyphomicrobiales bacterium]